MILFPHERLQLVGDASASTSSTLEIVERERSRSYTVQLMQGDRIVRCPYVQLVWDKGETFLMLQGAKEKGKYVIVPPIQPARQAFRDLRAMDHAAEIVLGYLHGEPHARSFAQEQMRVLQERVASLAVQFPKVTPPPKLEGDR